MPTLSLRALSLFNLYLTLRRNGQGQQPSALASPTASSATPRASLAATSNIYKYATMTSSRACTTRRPYLANPHPRPTSRRRQNCIIPGGNNPESTLSLYRRLLSNHSKANTGTNTMMVAMRSQRMTMLFTSTTREAQAFPFWDTYKRSSRCPLRKRNNGFDLNGIPSVPLFFRPAIPISNTPRRQPTQIRTKRAQ